MIILWLVLVGLVTTPVVLLLIGRRNERRQLGEWQPLLTRGGAAAAGKLELELRTELAASEIPYERAKRKRAEGDLHEAMRLLDVGSRAIEMFAPNMLRALAAMASLSRMVSAIAPVRPLRPADFRAAEMVQLAHFNRFVHHLVVTAKERFRLRVTILARGIRTVTHLLLRSSRRADPEWDAIDDLRADLQTLSEESIRTFRLLVESAQAPGSGRNAPPA